MGKTRLALEIANRLLSRQQTLFPDGIFFVDLATATTADDVLAAIADTLALDIDATQSLEAGVSNALKAQCALLILDNFEQVLVAADSIGTLLSVAPCLRLIVTSRTLLNLYGEHEFAVKPLTLPPSKPSPAAV